VYLELAAGRGWLARDIVDALTAGTPELANRFRPVLVDASAGMREAAARAVPEAVVSATVPADPGATGCAMAVEWLDALPVHRVRRRGRDLVELAVGAVGDELVELEVAPSPDVGVWAERYGAAPDDGDEAEVALALGPALEVLSSGLGRGFVVIVDYGHEAAKLFGPAHRRGTLLAYHRHQANEDYLARVGRQDLTAHVNLTALRHEAERLGWRVLSVMTQDRFLIANGILEALAAADDTSLEATKQRLQAKQLIHPHGMGRTFKVAVFAKGLAEDPALPGLRDPFAG
jgi:SAM-dependent MidA family methyltransferase